MSSATPLVSVVIPNRNYSSVLGLCLQALRAQTLQPAEVIVADDGSTDDSVAVATSWGATVVHTPGARGSAVARNTGAAHAHGDILFFLDSDVALAPDALANAVVLLQADPRIGAVCGIEDPEPLIRDSLIEEYRTLQYHYWEISSLGVISFLCSAMVAIPATVFAEVGPFNTRLRHTEEVDYGQRVSEHYQVVLTAKVHGAHDHDASLRLLLRKLFNRGRMRIPAYLRARRLARGYETASRVWACAAAMLAVLSLPGLLIGPAWAALPAGLAVASLALDAGMYRFVVRRRGLAFGLYFTVVHFVVNLTIAVAVAAGGMQWVCSKSFRRVYDLPADQTVTA
jgi:glycosyltransferase involved in cell wall biosynthesis